MAVLPTRLSGLATGARLRRVLLAYALFALVELSAWLAVVLFAYDVGGARLAAIVTVAQLVPAAALAPPLTALGERLPRGTALCGSHAAVAATAGLTGIAISIELPVWSVVVASATLTTSLAVVRPLHFAALPQLARGPRDLVSANSLSSIADGAAVFVGPMLAGFAAAVSGPALVLAGGAVAGALAAALCLGLRLAASAPDGEDDQGWRTSLRGFAVLRYDGGALALLLVMTTTFIIAGALDVLGVALAQDVLDLGPSGAGLVVGSVGIGGLAGAIAAAPFAARRVLAPMIITCGVLQGVAVAVVAVFDLIAPVMICLAVAGFWEAVLLVCGRTLLQRTVADEVLARVFAVQESMSLLGLAVGAGAAPALIVLASTAGAFAPLGIAAALLALAAVVLVRRLDGRSVYLPDELALMRGVSFLAVLPTYELERLARRASWLDVPAQTDVVRQGEAGDIFYVIADGGFTVVVDGVARPDALGLGESFGEIALLNSTARTATVRAATSGRLLAIRSSDFLAAVTGSRDGTAIAAEVTAGHLARDRARRT